MSVLLCWPAKLLDARLRLRQSNAMDDLRAAVATALGLTPASRLIAIDAATLVDGAALAVYAAVGTKTVAAPRGVIADPLRLPFVAAVADLVLVNFDATGEPIARLREVWRILAPAGALVVVVPMPSSYSLKSLITRRLIRRRLHRWLAAAMFEPVTSQTTASGHVVRAGKRDGLAPQRRATAPVRAVATT